jgi:hypothetical protein
MGIRKQLLAWLFGVDVALIEKLEKKLSKQASKGGKDGKDGKDGKGRKSKKQRKSGKKSSKLQVEVNDELSALPRTTPEQEAARILERAEAEAAHKKGAP